MGISYVPTTWVNGETQLNADNLNHIEQGIELTASAIGGKKRCYVVGNAAAGDTEADCDFLFTGDSDTSNLNAFIAQVKGEIHFRRGTYGVTDPLDFTNSNITKISGEYQKTIFKPSNFNGWKYNLESRSFPGELPLILINSINEPSSSRTVIVEDLSVNLQDISIGMAGISVSGESTVQRCSVKGLSGGYDSVAHTGIQGRGKIIIRDNQVRDCQYGIVNFLGDTFLIEGNKVNNCWYGIHSTSYGTQGNIINNYISKCWYSHIYMSSRGNVIGNNVYMNVAKYPMNIEGIFVQNSGDSFPVGVYNNYVKLDFNQSASPYYSSYADQNAYRLSGTYINFSNNIIKVAHESVPTGLTRKGLTASVNSSIINSNLLCDYSISSTISGYNNIITNNLWSSADTPSTTSNTIDNNRSGL